MSRTCNILIYIKIETLLRPTLYHARVGQIAVTLNTKIPTPIIVPNPIAIA